MRCASLAVWMAAREADMAGGYSWRTCVLLVWVVGWAAGCMERITCTRNSECNEGQVCMRIAPSEDDVFQGCVTPCETVADCPQSNARCSCPDSPAGKRCSVVEGPGRDGGTYFCSGDPPQTDGGM